MMGDEQVMREGLFYEFAIERHVPVDHLPRVIDRCRLGRYPSAAKAILLQHGPTIN